MRDRLSQKTTVCYGFPLALQLFVFDVVPLLLEKIPDAGNTATFIDSPGACSSPSTILTVNEIVAVEEDPDLSVHFTVIPDEERLLLVDHNEDRQVTSLVQKLLCGKTFKPEDFPGGDQSFSPKFKVPDAAQGEGACPTPVRQRKFRPRNTVPIEVEDISSSGNSGEENRQCSERCTHKNLKHWISQRFEGMENNIEELRTLICKSLGLPEGSKRNARKRKAMDDPQVRRTPSPDDSIVSETEGRNRKGKKRKTKLDHSSSETSSTSSFSSNSSSWASSVASSGISSYPWLYGSTSKISFVACSGTSSSFTVSSCKGGCSSTKESMMREIENLKMNLQLYGGGHGLNLLTYDDLLRFELQLESSLQNARARKHLMWQAERQMMTCQREVEDDFMRRHMKEQFP
ncbi:unnamed protein product, partial [Brassica oleracea]